MMLINPIKGSKIQTQNQALKPMKATIFNKVFLN